MARDPFWIRLVAWLSPGPWADSIAGDAAEEWSRRRGFARVRLVVGTLVTLARLAPARRLWRDARGPAPGRMSRAGGTLGYEVRDALRTVGRRPGEALVIACVMALGIGANTAVFSVANWLLFRPVPGVTDPDRVVTLRIQSADLGSIFPVSMPDYEAFAGMDSVDGLAAYSQTPLHVASGGRASRVSGEIVTPGYFTVLRLRFLRGRPFSDAEAMDPARARVAVVSERFWRRSLGGPEVPGALLTVNGHAFTITGVAAAGFHGMALPGETDVWVPIGAHREVLSSAFADPMTNRRTSLFMGLLARRSAGVSLERVQADAALRLRQIAAAHPDDRRIQNRVAGVYPGAGTHPSQRRRLNELFGLLMGLVGMLLLLTCANVANLRLAGLTRRRGELALRGALGASRARLIGRSLVETLIVGLAGGLLALPAAALAGRWLEGAPILTFVTLDRVGLDVRVYLFAVVVSIAASMMAGAVPALAASRAAVWGGTLRDASRSQTSRGRLRGSLTVAQVAISMALLVGAALLARSLAALRGVELGFDATTLSFSVDPGVQGYTPEEQQAFYRGLLDRLHARGEIEEAALGWIKPFGRFRFDSRLALEGASDGDPISAASNLVSPGFFAALGIALVDGRTFEPREFLSAAQPGSLRPLIVSESLARQLISDGRAVGQIVSLPFPAGERWEIVGVAANARMRSLDGAPHAVYEPFGGPFTPGWSTVHVRTRLPNADAADIVRREVAAIDPALPVYDLGAVGEAIDGELAEPRLMAAVSAAFSAIAALLAALGVYGVMAQGVAERTRELGIRTALGASPFRLLGGVARRGLVLAGAGMATGLMTAAALTGVLESRLHGIERFDAVSYAGAATALLALALAATLLPALRAASTDPVVALRAE